MTGPRRVLLALDASINLGLGVLLLVVPLDLIRVLGLPETLVPFYLQILGGVLLGVGIALALELPEGRQGYGLGLMGAVAINLAAASVLLGVLVAVQEVSLLGRAVLGGLVAVLLGLSGAEIYASRSPEAEAL